MINHYVLAHKEDVNLKNCISSLLKSTHVQQRIIVVYNGKKTLSTDVFFSDLLSNSNIEVFYVGFNAFTYGVSLAMRKFQSITDQYYIVSDGDFIFPNISKGDWLEHFLYFLDTYPMVGRAGLGIMLDNLIGKTHLENILEAEKRYLNGFTIENFYHAPIDTTPAVYRKNIFYWGNVIFPGHMTGMKPCFITMRCSRFLGYHLGWDTAKYREERPIISYSSLISFGLFNGAFPREVLSRQDVLKKITYSCASLVGRTYWRARKLAYILKYIIANKFVFLNELEKNFDEL